MSNSAKKWLLWGSIALIAVSIVGLILSAIVPGDLADDLLEVSLIVLIIAVANLVFLLSVRYQEKKTFRRTIKILSYLFPVFAILIFTLDMQWLPDIQLIYSTLILLMLFSIPVVIIYVFILNDLESKNGLILLIAYISLSLILRRFNSNASEEQLVISLLMTGVGMYIFSIRCISVIEKNRFLKIVSLIAGLLIYFVCFALMFFSATYSDPFLVVLSILFILLTVVVLLTLPVSGYIQWNSIHKKILNKIIIPWVFFLLIISVRFIFPDLNNLLFKSKNEQLQEFFMNDYQILNKNGLEPE